MIDPDKKVILDADVLIHFIKGDFLFSIPIILSNELIILDKVYEEISQRKQKEIIDSFLDRPSVQLVEFPDAPEYISEYAHLTSTRGLCLGKGESACLVFARLNNDVVASSNLIDIKRYCSFHRIEYIDTIDLLIIGFETGNFTEDNCDEFIRTVRKKGSKLPNKSLRELLEQRS